MYIGRTDPQRPDRFIVIEHQDTPEQVLQYMHQHKIANLIIDGQHCEIATADTPFVEVLQGAEIVHLVNLNLKHSHFLYHFQQVKRLEIKQCKFTGKESIDWLQLPQLKELFSIYSPRFEHLFEHPQLTCIFLEKFSVNDFSFPINTQLEILCLEKSVNCQWETLRKYLIPGQYQ